MEGCSRAGERRSTVGFTTYSTADMMRMEHRLAWGALLAGGALSVMACGPLRLDGRPHIRGTLVSAETNSVAIQHRTGRTYRVEVTPDTRVVNTKRREDARLCAGRRATVYLVDAGRFTASSIVLGAGRCD